MCFTNTSLLSKRLAHCEIGSAAILFAPAYGMAVLCFYLQFLFGNKSDSLVAVIFSPIHLSLKRLRVRWL